MIKSERFYKKEKLFIFEFHCCPHCGMDGTIALFQALGKPNRIACKFCMKPIYDVEIIKTYFDANNIAENVVEKSERMQREKDSKKEIKEIKRLKTEITTDERRPSKRNSKKENKKFPYKKRRRYEK